MHMGAVEEEEGEVTEKYLLNDLRRVAIISNWTNFSLLNSNI